GVVSGTVFTVGTAWTKELSGGHPGLAARRAALALTAGFAVGPLVAGGLAQWAPLPTVLPYLVHLALAAIALALLPRAPETRWAGSAERRLRLVPPSVRTRRFGVLVAPMAPWVFGSASLAFTTLPAHGVRLPAATATVFTGLLAGVALGGGLAGQRFGRRLEAGTWRGGHARPQAIGLAVVAGGFAAAAVAAARPGVLTVVAAALVLGCGYGICLVVGLREVERLAGPDELGGLIAVFYSLTYLGLAIPFLLALAAPHSGYPPGLLVVSGVAIVTLASVLARARGLIDD
ncbi:MAG: hypothetical protein QOJ68_999, partial [Blastococcus sp.]|nr:hypothetical protein [Blastococcus sp.]